MKILDFVQRKRLWEWYLEADKCPKFAISNLTLTFDSESRKSLRQKQNGKHNPFVSEARRLMMKMSNHYPAHLFGYIAHESCSLSSKSQELIGEHIHILLAVRFDSIAPILKRTDFSPYWKHSSSNQVVLQKWDGDSTLIRYNYGPQPDHFHNVVVTSVFHPRHREECNNNSCGVCRLFPKPEAILDWENNPPPKTLFDCS